jgi:hypothetical protein
MPRFRIVSAITAFRNTSDFRLPQRSSEITLKGALQGYFAASSSSFLINYCYSLRNNQEERSSLPPRDFTA